jgi:hypothetical protein
MADTSIFNVEPPRWLQNSTSVDWFKTGQATGEVLGNIATSIGVESSKQFQDKEQGVNFFNKMVDASRVANDPLYLEKVDTFKAQAELTQATKKDQLQGMKEYAEWMKDTGGKGDWNGTSTYGVELAQKTALQNWMRSNQQAAIKVKQTEADNKIAAAKIKADTDAARIQAQRDIAGANNKSRETIANLKKTADDGFTPKIIPYGNSTLVQLGPHRWQYVRGDTVKAMNPKQLFDFANGLSDDDPNKDYLKKSAEAAAVNQTKGKKPATTSQAAPQVEPAANDLVTVINPSGKTVRIKSSDLDEALKSHYKQP